MKPLEEILEPVKDLTLDNVTSDDKETLDLFMELQIDGSTVAASNYTAVSGSTIVTLKESYAQTLTAGKHSIKFVYPDGEAVGSFTVVIPTNGSAETGDEAPILLLVVMMSVSLAGAAMLLERKRKV